jgi:hypothetical protein
MLPERFELHVVEHTGDTRIIWPQTLIDAKNRIDAKWTGVRAALATCGANHGTMTAFQANYSAWRQFYCRSTSTDCTQPDYGIWGLGGQMDDAETWDAMVYGWQQYVADNCGAPAPVAPPTPTGQKQFLPPEAYEAAKWLAIAAIVAAGVYLFGPLITAAVGAGATAIREHGHGHAAE